HRPVGAQHPMVPAHILVQAEHQHKAHGQQPVLPHPGRHKGLEQAEVGGGHKAAEKVAEQVHAPEHLFVVVVGRGGFIVNDVADGRGKTVHDFVAQVGSAGGDVGIVAQQRGLDRAAHAGGDYGIGGAVDGIGEPVHQIVPQIVEDAQVLEVLQTHLDIVDV